MKSEVGAIIFYVPFIFMTHITTSAAGALECETEVGTGYFGDISERPSCFTGSGLSTKNSIDSTFGGAWHVQIQFDDSKGLIEPFGWYGNDGGGVQFYHGNWGETVVAIHYDIPKWVWGDGSRPMYENDNIIVALNFGKGEPGSHHIFLGLIDRVDDRRSFSLGYEWNGVFRDGLYIPDDNVKVQGPGLSSVQFWGKTVPEPPIYGLMAIGLIGLFMISKVSAQRRNV